jgi:hypothetical protein|tara:strand:+ start:232 stop:513 length:282 start_codon:yes stop_codon:yes gene_type:complete
MIAADFGGRSIDFQTREITDYQPIIGALMKQWQNPENANSPAVLVADVIYTAVTDDSEQLRYSVSDEAKFLLDSRKKRFDDESISMIKNQIGQ